jgi:crossover junction endodeoxyribonuclease RuvC
MRKILGIDPGLASTGYGLIALDGAKCRHLAHGVIATAAGGVAGARLNAIFNELSVLIDRFRPDEAAVEEIYFAKNTKTALSVAQAKGVILLAFASKDIPVTEYSPLAIKRAVAGNGRADKVQVQELVRLILGLPEAPEPDHAADALAAAICHGHQSRFKRLAARKK